ncbi:Counting factor associated protein D [Nymphon striatum]|nr:Counting factor associated protein D [Nymphon striatum]
MVCTNFFCIKKHDDMHFYKGNRMKSKPILAVCFRDAPGVLFLPYAEIEEPFTAYFDAKANKIFQLASDGKYGTTKKVAFMSKDTQLNVQSCFQVNGTVNATVGIQSVFPDMTDFENCPVDDSATKICQIWRYINIEGKKKNTYTIGYDSLFGSHYDRYYLNYEPIVFGAVDPEKFEVDGNLTCGGFPGPGLQGTHLLNPMHEFINNDQSHIHKAFTAFKDTHKKAYKSFVEHDKRKEIFKQNFRFIHSTNRQGNGYTVAVNHMADLTKNELKRMRGKLPTVGYNGGEPYEDIVEEMYMPKTLDWHQAVCGSCWSFGTTGVLEGAILLKVIIQSKLNMLRLEFETGNLIRLSQQQLMDCSWGEGNNYMMKNGGLQSEETYGHYMGSDGKCHNNKSLSVVQIKSFVNVTSGDLTALRSAMFKHGPISVGIDAAVKSFSFYSNGVYYDKKCGNKLEDLDHAVLAVGYGILDGQPYWLVKNSWSTYWGNDGYVLISQKDNNCGHLICLTNLCPLLLLVQLIFLIVRPHHRHQMRI